MPHTVEEVAVISLLLFFLHLHIITSPLEAVQQRNGRDKKNTSAAPSSSSSVRVLRLLLRNEVSLSSSRSKAPPSSVSPEVEEEKKSLTVFLWGPADVARTA